MALALILGEAKLSAEQMETRADVTLEKQGDGFAITSVHLTLNAKTPGAHKAKFEDLPGSGTARSPVSPGLNNKRPPPARPTRRAASPTSALPGSPLPQARCLPLTF